MGRPSIYREPMLRVLEAFDRPLGLTEIRLGVEKELHLGPKRAREQNILYSLEVLIESGDVEKVTIEGRNTYCLTNSSYLGKNKSQLISLIDKAEPNGFKPRFGDEKIPPLTAHFDNLQNLDIPIRRKRTQSSSYGINWSDPIDLISRRILQSYMSLDIKDKLGIAELLAHAYWYGVQSLVGHFDSTCLSEVVSRHRSFAENVVQEAKILNKLETVETQKTKIQILEIASKVISKKNLNELLLFFDKQDLEVEKLEKQIGFSDEPASAGKVIYDRFQEFHSCVLIALEATGLPQGAITEDTDLKLIKTIVGKEGYLNYRYLQNYSDVWDTVISSILGFLTSEQLESINGDLDQTKAKIERHKEHFFRFMSLSSMSKTFVVYVWGYPEVFEVSDRAFLLRFAKWLSALKEGRLDDRSWIFSKETIAALFETVKEVEKGRVPRNGIIDTDYWNIWDLFLFHPRGTDASFWRVLLAEIKKRLLKQNNRELAFKIRDFLKARLISMT